MDNSTSTTTEATVATQAAPSQEVAENTVETVAVPTVESKTEVPDTKAADEVNYDWVPKKFLREGKPDFENMARSYQSLEKKIGSKGNFAPETVDEYEYTPKSVELDPEDHKAFKDFAKEAGLSTKQYAAVLEKYEEAWSKNAETPEKAEVHLKEAWGDDYEKHALNARKAYETYVPSDIPIEAIGNNPYLLRVLAQIGAELNEDTSTSKSGAGTTRMSRDDVKALMVQKEALAPNSKERKEMETTIESWYQRNIK